MKKRIAVVLVLLLLSMSACAGQPQMETTASPVPETAGTPADSQVSGDVQLEGEIIDIILDGTDITVGGTAAGQEEGAVCIGRDIVYYEDRQTYESGNPYGEGEAHERHSREEAAEHLVVSITQPGNYRISGTLTLGQIAIDLGEDACEDPKAVVNLILDGVDITCTVAPAIVFYNVYECDGDWSADTAQAAVDTSGAGANLILADGSENRVNGSHVARIYKDKEGEKKLWKMDGAIYSFMSMNVSGGGKLDLYADNEGLDTELHLTINGGDINIRSDNDGINTNEDGVSVTTINGGNLHIIAGLGAEGDGIDSNGYLVINGGTVVASANPASDAGLDSDLGSYINGGTVIALGSAMDWPESDSHQVTMNLQFAGMQSSGSAIVVTKEDGSAVFAYDPGADEVLGENLRQYMGAVISCGNFAVGQTYRVYMDAAVTGSEVGGIYDAASITAVEGGILQSYTGTDVMHGFGGGQRPGSQFGGQFGGQRPEGQPGQTPPEGEMPTMPEGETMGGFGGGRPEDMTFPEGQMPEDFTMPEGGEMPEGQMPPGGFGGMGGEASTAFYMQDKVNFFSGLTAAQ